MGVKKGDKVVVNYTGTLDDGTVFDTSYHEEHAHPIEFEVGNGQLIKGFDKGVIGMEVGEEKELKIKPEDAYGYKNQELIQNIPKESFKDIDKPEIGMVIELTTPEGQIFPGTITSINDKDITVDFNHPLAGQNLNFKIKLEEIK